MPLGLFEDILSHCVACLISVFLAFSLFFSFIVFLSYGDRHKLPRALVPEQNWLKQD
jgi:hypothetical protein